MATEKIHSIEPEVPTEDILKQIEELFPETSDGDEFFATYLTGILENIFSGFADFPDGAPYKQLNSRFAKAILHRTSAIFANMRKNISDEDRTSRMRESYQMPAPPEESTVETEYPATPRAAKCECLTHDSLSVISCEDGRDVVSFYSEKDETNIACKYFWT